MVREGFTGCSRPKVNKMKELAAFLIGKENAGFAGRLAKSVGWNISYVASFTKTKLATKVVTTRKKTRDIIAGFERHLVRSSSECAQVLGVSPSAYANYRRDDTAIPESMRNHIDVIQRLPLDRLHELVRERLHGDS